MAAGDSRRWWARHKRKVIAVVAPVVVVAGIGGATGVIRVPHACGCTTPVYGDVTPPVVSLTAPASLATVSGASVSVTATATDNVGVVSVQFRLDGSNLQAADTTNPYGITWDSTTASDASHVLTAVAVDAVGNTTISSSVTVTVSNGGAAPTANLWVDSSGSSACTRSSSPLTFAAAAGHICWNSTASSILSTAFTAASSSAGDTIRVTCASSPLGNQTLGSPAKTVATIIRPETDYCVTIEDVTGSNTSVLLSHTNWVNISYFNINGYQTSCGSLACGPAKVYTAAADASSTPNSHDVTFDHDLFDVGKLDGGSPIISDHLIKNLTVTNSTFGPTCCGLDVPNSPSPINIGKPGSSTGECTTPTESCGITINDNLFQFNAINQNFWPSSGYGTFPEITCVDAVHCHLDSIHDFGSGGTIQIMRNRFYGQSCQGIFFEVISNAVYGEIDIVGNTASTYANGCNGFISLNMTGTSTFTGDVNIGFNESPSQLNLLLQANAFTAGTHLNIYGNYIPRLLQFRTAGGSTATTDCTFTTGGGPPANLAIAYAYNDWRTGATCGTGDTTGSTTAWVDSSAPPAVTQNMHKTGGAGTADNFVTCAGMIGLGCPSIDFDGDSFAATADAGADQR